MMNRLLFFVCLAVLAVTMSIATAQNNTDESASEADTETQQAAASENDPVEQAVPEQTESEENSAEEDDEEPDC